PAAGRALPSSRSPDPSTPGPNGPVRDPRQAAREPRPAYAATAAQRCPHSGRQRVRAQGRALEPPRTSSDLELHGGVIRQENAILPPPLLRPDDERARSSAADEHVVDAGPRAREPFESHATQVQVAGQHDRLGGTGARLCERDCTLELEPLTVTGAAQVHV